MAHPGCSSACCGPSWLPQGALHWPKSGPFPGETLIPVCSGADLQAPLERHWSGVGSSGEPGWTWWLFWNQPETISCSFRLCCRFLSGILSVLLVPMTSCVLPEGSPGERFYFGYLFRTPIPPAVSICMWRSRCLTQASVTPGLTLFERAVYWLLALGSRAVWVPSATDFFPVLLFTGHPSSTQDLGTWTAWTLEWPPAFCGDSFWNFWQILTLNSVKVIVQYSTNPQVLWEAQGSH